MKNFLLRIHNLITNPAFFVHSYRNERIGTVLPFVLMVAVVMLGSSAMIRTIKVVRELPPVVGLTFDGVVIENGILNSINGTIVPKRWQNQEIKSILSGRTEDIEFVPESLIVISPDGTVTGYNTFTADSLIIDLPNTGKNDVSKRAYPLKPFARLGYKIDFSEKTFSKILKENPIALFLIVGGTFFIYTLRDIVFYVIMLLFLIVIYRGELSQHWVKKSTVKILLNGLVPYFILLPMFSVAGNRADLLVYVAIATSAIIISRAFRFHRISLLVANKQKEDL